MPKLKKGQIYHVLCRPFGVGSWRELIYRGYNRRTDAHIFEEKEPRRLITVKARRLWKRVRPG